MFNEIIEVVGVTIVLCGDDIRDGVVEGLPVNSSLGEVAMVATVICGDDIRDGVEGMLVDSIPLDEMLNDDIVATVILGDDSILDPNEKGMVATVICGDDAGNTAECSLVNSTLDETSSDDGIM